MKAWLDKLNQVKGALTAVVAIIAATIALWAYWDRWFVSEAEAGEEHAKIQNQFESYQQQQYRAHKSDRLDRFKREINRIDYQLLSQQISAQQREYLQNQRKDVMRKIDCVEKDEC